MIQFHVPNHRIAAKVAAFGVLLLAVLLLAMTPAGERTARDARSMGPAVQDLKPPSELALLMRVMAAHVDSAKVALRRGDDPPPYPDEVARLFTATPTDGMFIDPITYPVFGEDYLRKLEAYQRSDKDGRAMTYNALVQSCANCHGTHCPGPLMRIKKMYVELE